MDSRNNVWAAMVFHEAHFIWKEWTTQQVSWLDVSHAVIDAANVHAHPTVVVAYFSPSYTIIDKCIPSNESRFQRIKVNFCVHFIIMFIAYIATSWTLYDNKT